MPETKKPKICRNCMLRGSFEYANFFFCLKHGSDVWADSVACEYYLDRNEAYF